MESKELLELGKVLSFFVDEKTISRKKIIELFQSELDMSESFAIKNCKMSFRKGIIPKLYKKDLIEIVEGKEKGYKLNLENKSSDFKFEVKQAYYRENPRLEEIKFLKRSLIGECFTRLRSSLANKEDLENNFSKAKEYFTFEESFDFCLESGFIVEKDGMYYCKKAQYDK